MVSALILVKTKNCVVIMIIFSINNSMDLLNRITLKDGKQLCGVIDYVTDKHVYFFDTEETTIDFLMLVILWIGNADHLRFSVYITQYYPGITLPTAKLIPISNIQHSNKPIVVTEKVKQRRRMIKT